MNTEERKTKATALTEERAELTSERITLEGDRDNAKEDENEELFADIEQASLDRKALEEYKKKVANIEDRLYDLTNDRIRLECRIDDLPEEDEQSLDYVLDEEDIESDRESFEKELQDIDEAYSLIQDEYAAIIDEMAQAFPNMTRVEILDVLGLEETDL